MPDPHHPDDETPPPVGDPTVDRRRAVVVAGHTGDAATVRAGLRDRDPGVRAAALGALARLAEQRDEASGPDGELGAALRAGLVDAVEDVRRRAAGVAARARVDPDVLAALVTALDDERWTVAEAAAAALGEHPSSGDGALDARAVDALARTAVEHEDAMCRESAVAALGAIGAPAGLPAVLAATGDRANVRRRAVLALAAFDGDEVTGALVRLTGDRDLQVRQAAEELLAIEAGEPT